MRDALAYSINELPEVLPIGRSLIFEEIKSGALRSFTVGRRRLVSHDAVREYIRAKEKASGGG